MAYDESLDSANFDIFSLTQLLPLSCIGVLSHVYVRLYNTEAVGESGNEADVESTDSVNELIIVFPLDYWVYEEQEYYINAIRYTPTVSSQKDEDDAGYAADDELGEFS